MAFIFSAQRPFTVTGKLGDCRGHTRALPIKGESSAHLFGDLFEEAVWLDLIDVSITVLLLTKPGRGVRIREGIVC